MCANPKARNGIGHDTAHTTECRVNVGNERGLGFTIKANIGERCYKSATTGCFFDKKGRIYVFDWHTCVLWTTENPLTFQFIKFVLESFEYCVIRPFLWGGWIGPILTDSSKGLIAPLYPVKFGLKTSLNFCKRSLNWVWLPGLSELSGSTEIWFVNWEVCVWSMYVFSLISRTFTGASGH